MHRFLPPELTRKRGASPWEYSFRLPASRSIFLLPDIFQVASASPEQLWRGASSVHGVRRLPDITSCNVWGLRIAELTTSPFLRVEIIHSRRRGQAHWQADSCLAGRVISMFIVHSSTKYISEGMHLLPCQRKIYFYVAEKLTVTQLVNGFPASYGKRMFTPCPKHFSVGPLSTQTKSVYNIISYPLKINFNIIFQCTPRYRQLTLSFSGFSD
jgi:hypothetical protein